MICLLSFSEVMTIVIYENVDIFATIQNINTDKSLPLIEKINI